MKWTTQSRHKNSWIGRKKRAMSSCVSVVSTVSKSRILKSGIKQSTMTSWKMLSFKTTRKIKIRNQSRLTVPWMRMHLLTKQCWPLMRKWPFLNMPHKNSNKLEKWTILIRTRSSSHFPQREIEIRSFRLERVKANLEVFSSFHMIKSLSLRQWTMMSWRSF